ncbi:hypothetical protein BC835DRAFT_1314420 [Cytidiella melzeri]|nr:hypothetical protein BC835DRAFT_1314420 [Cytidiella melzeri]
MPKKTFVHNSRNKQTFSMSLPHPRTVNATMPPASLPEDNEDEDDICPVCESECTCRNRVNLLSSSRGLALTPTSTSTSTTYSQPRQQPDPPTTHLPSLKIKLTVPPSLKFRKDSAVASHGPAPQSSQTLALPHHALDFTVTKRRGRPPKAVVAAREAAKAALLASRSTPSDRAHAPPLRSPFTLASTPAVVLKSKSQPLNKKVLTKLKGKNKSRGKGVTVQSTSSLSSLSDSDKDVQFPTFMSAASSSLLTSSSESSEIDSDGLSSSDLDLEDEERFILQKDHDKARVKKETLMDESSHKRRNDLPSNRWEIKPRKKSVGAGESDSEGDTEESSEEEEEADDEDDGEVDENDEAIEADIEEIGAVEASAYKDMDEDEDDGKLGVSFSGWSEDDEESSFDAELFFANLDDSSDSDASPAALNNHDFASENDQFSTDEEDALLPMDVDSSAHTRRARGEFEVGIDLDGLSLSLDGSLLPSPFGPFEDSLSFDCSTESDVEMTANDDSDSNDDSDELALVETDGETTEDELVNSDGLPNSRAMMMFRWPDSVSTVDPQSTMSPGSLASPPPATPAHTSRTTRIALASMPAQRGSPAPTPAEILAGKISMDDLDHNETSNDGHADTLRSSRSCSRRSGVPMMGHFVTTPVGEGERHAVIDGSGSMTPSPFPRSRILRAKRRRTSSLHQSATSLKTDAEGRVFRASSISLPLVSVNTPSSDGLGSRAFTRDSNEPLSTDVIDLDDVLDASMLDSEPAFDSDEPSQDPWATPKTPVAGADMHSLTRWDRIPVATFRRTREIPLLETTPASDSGISGRFASIGALSNDMLGTPKTSAKTKTSLNKRSKGKVTTNLLAISPVLMAVRDGDRTPTNTQLSPYNPFHEQQQQQQHDPLHQQKSRRNQHNEKAMLKKKKMGKYAANSPSRPAQRHHRTHFPNMKTRGSGSMQRTQFFASNSSHVPHLNL